MRLLNRAPLVFPDAFQSANIVTAKYPKLHIITTKIVIKANTLIFILNIP